MKRKEIAKASAKIILGLFTITASWWTLSLSYPKIAVQDIANWLAFSLPFAYIAFFVIIDYTEARPTPSPSNSIERLQEEYKTLGQTAGRRENSLLVSGSIFVTAAAVLLSQFGASRPQQEQLAIVFGSWALYCTWLFFFQLTAGRLTDATFRRLKGIEEKLEVNVHRYLVTKRDPARRWVWLWLLDGLVVIGFLLLGLDVVVLKMSLFVQVITIVSYSLAKPLLVRLFSLVAAYSFRRKRVTV